MATEILLPGTAPRRRDSLIAMTLLGALVLIGFGHGWNAVRRDPGFPVYQRHAPIRVAVTSDRFVFNGLAWEPAPGAVPRAASIPRANSVASPVAVSQSAALIESPALAADALSAGVDAAAIVEAPPPASVPVMIEDGPPPTLETPAP